MDCDICAGVQKGPRAREATLTETGRLRHARCVVDDGSPLHRAAEHFQVSPTTAQRWADHYRRSGAAGMTDRSSRRAPADDTNGEFGPTDAARVIGANDVTNSAARSNPASPIDSELYYTPKTAMLFGDAKSSVPEIPEELKAL